jgi:hypothetical protein
MRRARETVTSIRISNGDTGSRFFVAMKSQQTISVKEARKLLGKESSALSDTQIIEIIDNLMVLAQKCLHSHGSRITVGVYDTQK